MKILFNKLSLTILIFSLLTSCESENSNEISPILITLSSNDNNVTISENAINGDLVTYTITATIDEPQELDIVINQTQTSGNALRGFDFDFEDTITISSGNTFATTLITVFVT